jgi:D-alanine-D-alanine ligase
MEVNPLAGLHPKESDLVILGGLRGVPYVELIERIVASATSRSAARSAGRAQATVAPHEAAPRG